MLLFESTCLRGCRHVTLITVLIEDELSINYWQSAKEMNALKLMKYFSHGICIREAYN